VTCDRTTLGMIEALVGNGETKTSVSLPFFNREIETLLSQMKTPNNEPKTFDTFLQSKFSFLIGGSLMVSFSDLRKHFGVILLFDAKQNDLKDIFRSYPFLYQRCRLTWLDNWKDVTMKEIPKK
jgi:hypothetical protein